MSAPGEDAAESSTRLGTVRPIVIELAATCGALLGALVALMQGSAALAGFAITLARTGYFENWLILAAYAGRSLVGLLLIVLTAAATGALAWAGGALIWNRIVAVTVRQAREESAG